MKKVKEKAKQGSEPIWSHFTKEKPAKTVVKRRINNRFGDRRKKFANNPLTNVFAILTKKRSTSKAAPKQKQIVPKINNMITNLFQRIGNKRSTSRVNSDSEVEKQRIEDRFGDGWHK